jgi:hypothetical protein
MAIPDPRPLLFAVLDGGDPAGWKPWDGAAHGTLAEIIEPALQLVEPADHQTAPTDRAIRFQPLLIPTEGLLQSATVGRIVGAIFDATADPEDDVFYGAKIEELRRICLYVERRCPSDELMVRRLASFNIWFILNGPDHDPARWVKWESRAREVVSRTLMRRVDVFYVPLPQLFKPAVYVYLKNMWDFLEQTRLT